MLVFGLQNLMIVSLKWQNLNEIAKHDIKDHTIIIDDIPVYFPGREELLEQKLYSINKDYNIEYFPVDMGSKGRIDGYELVAYIE